jgi:hypothetical protein
VYDATWRLPVRALDREQVTKALESIVAKHAGMKLGPAVVDREEFADELEDLVNGERTVLFSIGVRAHHLRTHGDQPESEPDDDGLFWGVIVVMPGDEVEGPELSELSVALGGSNEPEPD